MGTTASAQRRAPDFPGDRSGGAGRRGSRKRDHDQRCDPASKGLFRPGLLKSVRPVRAGVLVRRKIGSKSRQQKRRNCAGPCPV